MVTDFQKKKEKKDAKKLFIKVKRDIPRSTTLTFMQEI